MGKEATAEEIKQYVVFKLGKESFGLDIKKVITIEKQLQYSMTRIPRAPEFVKGVINLRGEIITIISLKEKFGLEESEATEESRIIIVKIDETSIGFIVDSVQEVVYIANSSIENIGELGKGVNSNYIQGIGKLENRIVSLLNISTLIEFHQKN